MDDAALSIDVGFREALSIFEVEEEVGRGIYLVLYERWDRTGGVEQEERVAQGGAEECILAAAEWLKEKRREDAMMEDAMVAGDEDNRSLSTNREAALVAARDIIEHGSDYHGVKQPRIVAQALLDADEEIKRLNDHPRIWEAAARLAFRKWEQTEGRLRDAVSLLRGYANDGPHGLERGRAQGFVAACESEGE